MKQQQSLRGLRDWLFGRMVAVLLNGDWMIIIEDFSKSKKRSERKYVGLTNFNCKTIFLDQKDGDLLILCHELGHVVFQDILIQEGIGSAKIEINKLKGKNKIIKWTEGRVWEWAKYFRDSLDAGQKEILQMFIDFARKRP